MANRKMNLSGTGKEILDQLCNHLEVERPRGIKLALAKGLSTANGKIHINFKDGNKTWTIPDNLIREKEYLLFKHLIINEFETNLTEEQINQNMLLYIEFGLRTIKLELDEISSLEDYRIKILT